MALRKVNVRANQSRQQISDKRLSEYRVAPPADVPSIVEHRFMLMDQTHDRIRAEELAARLSDRKPN